ncbi:MAG: integrase [Chloroflexota bacterium]|nr:MAG: integrase [Chloroflexota bacterium]
MINQTTPQTPETALMVQTPLDQNPAAVFLAGLSTENSRKTMKQALDGIARMLGAADCFAVQWGAMRFQHVNAIKSRLNEKYKPATVNKYLSALRGVLLAAKQLGQMSIEEYDRAVSVKSVKGSTLPAGRDLSDKEIRRLFAICEGDNTPSGARDAGLFAVMRLGLRASEVAGLNLADFDQPVGRLIVRGKGNKERIVPISNGSLKAVLDWLEVRGTGDGPLFCAVAQGGKVTGQPISRQAIFKICSKRATEAKIADFSPHDFRRTFVGDLLDAGADIVTVKDLAGHASIQTTARYDRRGQERLHNAIDLLNTPYTGRRQEKLGA